MKTETAHPQCGRFRAFTMRLLHLNDAWNLVLCNGNYQEQKKARIFMTPAFAHTD